MILLIDNYDSFSHNLSQLLAAAGAEVRVVRNDAIDVPGIERLAPEALVLSPGPGHPADAGICVEAVHALTGRLPILGVCLGHQAICEALGGTVGHAPQVMHGKSSIVMFADGCALFDDVRFPMRAGRYHSLSAEAATLPTCLRVTAQSEDGDVMAVEHVEHPTYGLQFHPESILTPDGPAIARNFMGIVSRFERGEKR